MNLNPAISEWIVAQARHWANTALPVAPVVVDNTSRYMSIERDHVIALENQFFLVRCNEREGRFGIDDQPKFWVKRALNLATGRMHILKLAINEEFKVRIGNIDIRCARSAEKEGRVLDVVRGDERFMQGRTARDSAGNPVQVIDFISATDLLNHVQSMSVGHEQYARDVLPGILARVTECLRAIGTLHDAGLCHGDIRNDHLLVERGTGRYRWIDFDLNQDFLDFDVWSTGNILHYVAGKGFVTFRETLAAHPELSGRLSGDDASVFFPHRVMNLGKVYPYLPSKLNQVLLRFSTGTQAGYEKISQVTDDLEECASALGWRWSVRPAVRGVPGAD